MEKSQLIESIEEILEVDEGTLQQNTVLDEIEEWDSLAKLSLMAVAKKDYNKILTADQIRSFVTVDDICKALI